MKKIFTISIIALICASVSAQLPVTSKIKTQPTQITASLGSVAFNASYSDTLKSGDTLFYKWSVAHTGIIYPYISLLKKNVASDTTFTVTFWQSVDGSHNWVQVLNTTTPTAWATDIAKTITGTDISFWRSVGYFESTYLGMRLISKTKSGCKNIAYGSIRINVY